MGDPAGTLVTLNTTAATADFDFTATQDVPAVYDVTTTVVFDSVAFSGTGNLTFGSPADGGYGAPVRSSSLPRPCRPPARCWAPSPWGARS